MQFYMLEYIRYVYIYIYIYIYIYSRLEIINIHMQQPLKMQMDSNKLI
jgi:hypothetical protein